MAIQITNIQVIAIFNVIIMITTMIMIILMIIIIIIALAMLAAGMDGGFKLSPAAWWIQTYQVKPTYLP